MQLIVLGMHRSGTSTLAGLLNLMGAYFAPPGLSTGANKENPKGFFERRDIRALNDAVLGSLGCDWAELGNFSTEALMTADLTLFEPRAREIVSELNDHQPWFAKEPRFCLLFPFWRQFLDRPVCLHIIRNPLEVAMSLKTRNGFPFQFGLAIWEIYTRLAFQSSRGLPRILVHHSELIRNPHGEMVRVYEWLEEIGLKGLQQPTQEQVGQFVDPKLYRQRAALHREEEFLNAPQLALHQGLLKGIPEQTEDLGPVSESARETLAAFSVLSQTQKAVGDAKKALTLQERKCEELTASLDDHRDLLSRNEHDLDLVERNLNAAEKRLRKFEADFEQLRNELIRTRETLRLEQDETEEFIRKFDQLFDSVAKLSKSLRGELEHVLGSRRWKLGTALSLNFSQLRSEIRLKKLREFKSSLQEILAWKKSTENEWAAARKQRARTRPRQKPPVPIEPGPAWQPLALESQKRCEGLLAALDPSIRTTIVIPIFNSLADLRLCVESVLRHTRGNYRLLLVNDCSSDPAIAPALEEWSQKHAQIEVLTNGRNLGFVATANAGMRAAAPDDVVLLNSDTIVTARWLQKLRVAAYRSPNVATATPFSNAAGAFSVPVVGANEALPIHMDVSSMGRLVERASADEYPKIPTGNGFCMFIRRTAIEQAGGFDEERFGRGYGEENDFCMRLGAMGWSHVIADSLFIYHRRNASFGAEREALLKANRAVLNQLHPTYSDLIAKQFHSRQMNAIRDRIGQAMNAVPAVESAYKPRLLFVFHHGGGGVPQTTGDLASGLAGDYESFLLTSSGRELILSRCENGSSVVLQRWPLSGEWSAQTTHSAEFRRLYLSILLALKPDVVHVRHLFKHSLDLPDIARRLGIPVVLSFHDFYFVCPSVHLLDQESRYCGGSCTPGSGQCTIPSPMLADLPVLKEYVGEWRREVGKMLEACDAFVTTAASVRDVHLKHLPELGGKPFHVIEHGRDVFQRISAHSLRDFHGGRVRILAAGNLDRHKGSVFLAELARLDGGQLLEFHFLGTIDENLEGVGTYHGPYSRSDFPGLARHIRPDFAAVFSLWPETWSHTLTEAWSLGLPVFGSKLGAVGERIEKLGAGWTFDCTNPAAALEQIRAILADSREVALKRRAVRTMRFKSVSEMAAQYAFLYESLLRYSSPSVGALEPVALLLPERAGASSYVRVLQPLRHELVRSRLFGFLPDHPQNAETLEPFLDERGIRTVLIQRDALNESRMLSVIALCKSRGFRLIYELDDDLLRISTDHPEHEKYVAAARAIRKVSTAADQVIVSTEPLRTALEPFSGSIHVLQNRLDERLWFSPARLPRRRNAPDEVRAGYIGSFTHDADLEMIRPALRQARETLAMQGIKLRFFLIGGARATTGSEGFERISVPSSSRRYPEFVRWLRETVAWDFALAPLFPSALNEAKSELKFLEYTALGMPGIYSAVGGYRTVVRPDVDGLLIQGEPVEAWTAAIVRMATDEGLRASLLENARSRILQEYRLAQSAQEMCQVLLGAPAEEAV